MNQTASNYPASGWHAGLAAVDITPEEPIFLAGWSHRTEPSEGVSQRIFVKALALGHAGDRAVSVLVSSDLLAYSVEFVDEITRIARERFGIDRARLVLCASHSHSSPVTTNVLPMYYELTDQQTEVVQRYSDGLRDKFIEAIGRAIDDMGPATIEYGQSMAGFAINRRRYRVQGRPRPGPVDHDVPVLCIRRPLGEVRGIVFGYACHTTSVRDGKVNGDYAGFAQAELEALYPGAVAMFIAGCGGDQGPQPRYHEGLGQTYGHILALAVDEVIRGNSVFPSEPLVGPLGASAGIATLHLQPPPSREELLAMLPDCTGIRLREVQHQLARLDAGQPLITEYPYPVQVWRFGSGHTFVILSSEVVVDYALRFKQIYGFDKTWVMAYANEHIAYIPSRRVLEEGDYEGTLGMMENGLPSPFTPDVESTIIHKIEALWYEAEPRPAPAPTIAAAAPAKMKVFPASAAVSPARRS